MDRLGSRSAAILLLMLFGAPPATAQARFPGRVWENANAADMGWSTSKLRKAQDQFREMGSTALLIVQDGQVIAAWGDTHRNVKIHSVRKSFMSALVGIIWAQGRIALDSTMQALGIDDKPPRLTAQEKFATVRDLLMARSGIYHEAAAETASMRKLRPERGSHPHGTFWYYNNWDFNALATIIKQATGEDTFVSMENRIARPLGMEQFTARNGEYAYARASEHPAYHMYFTARDLARFGWLYLNQGRWHDQQVVPAKWVAESTRPWSPNARRGVAYGYLWWVSMNGVHFRTSMGPGSYSARGNGGQFIVVAPARRIVVVHLNDQSENDRLESGAFNELMQLIFDAAPQR